MNDDKADFTQYKNTYKHFNYKTTCILGRNKSAEYVRDQSSRRKFRKKFRQNTYQFVVLQLSGRFGCWSDVGADVAPRLGAASAFMVERLERRCRRGLAWRQRRLHQCSVAFSAWLGPEVMPGGSLEEFRPVARRPFASAPCCLTAWSRISKAPSFLTRRPSLWDKRGKPQFLTLLSCSRH